MKLCWVAHLKDFPSWEACDHRVCASGSEVQLVQMFKFGSCVLFTGQSVLFP